MAISRLFRGFFVFCYALIVISVGSLSVSYPSVTQAQTPKKIYLPIIGKCSGIFDDIRPNATGPLIPNKIYYGYPEDPNDYYYIDLNVSGAITVTVSNFQATGDLVLRNIAGLELAQWGRKGNTMHVSKTGLSPGRYFIQVYVDVSKGFHCNYPYSLVATFSLPLISITEPKDILVCDVSLPQCVFTIRGTSTLEDYSDVRIYTLVYPLDPSGNGWYLQHPFAIIDSSNGTWIQSPAVLGSPEYPAKDGDMLLIVAIIVHKNATYNGIPLDMLPPESPIPDIHDIQGIIAISPHGELTVDKK